MDGRAHKRVAVDREVQCNIGGIPGWVKLYDLSAGGAMLEVGGVGLDVGDTIELNLYDLITVSGQVVWKVDGNAGVRFDSPLSDWILERLGFAATSFGFDELPPRDRYGQLLATSPGGTTGGAGEEQIKPEALPSEWHETVQLEEDRRGEARKETSRRREERLKLNVAARLNTKPRVGIEGRLTNLSASGCSFLDPSRSFMLGDWVWLQVEPLESWRGIVRWVKGDQIGIEFERPFHPAVVDHLVATSRAAVWLESN